MLQACQRNQEKISQADYEKEIAEWDVKRAAYLKSEEGWLNLAGLFWLKEGFNTFGSAADNDLVFPKYKIPEHAGYFLLNQGIVSMQINEDVSLEVNGIEQLGSIIFHPDSARITIDYPPLHWFVIKRENQYAIRLRDFEHDELINFHGIDRFPPDLAWRIPGTFEAAQPGASLAIINVLGQNISMKLAGTLSFNYKGNDYKLLALDEEIGADLFVIFSDETNARETYGAGRYMYVSWPEVGSNKVIIDFNKAYNPPCAFTDFATCPLPPKQNQLPFAVKAGELNYGAH